MYTTATTSNDISKCENIDSKDLKDGCKNDILMNEITNKLDTKLCEKYI